MSGLYADLRHALRRLRRAPGFTAVVVATLSIGIGANASIFSVVNAALLRPLPYERPDELVRLYSEREGALWTVSPPDFVDWRSQVGALAEAAAVDGSTAVLSTGAASEHLPTGAVTSGYFAVLRARPALGRLFVAEDDVPGQDRVLVLGDRVWRSRFGADPGVVGRTARLDSRDYTVIGVLPAGFEDPYAHDLWIPMAFSADDLQTQRGAHYLDVLARLRTGVSIERAAEELGAVAARIAAEHPRTNAKDSAAVVPLRRALVGDVSDGLLLLLGAVGLVLLIGCVNVANLLLARAVGQQRELAVRSALGAPRSRLVRAALVESLVLGLAGGAGGLALAVLGNDLLLALRPQDVPLLETARADGAVVGFTAALALSSGLLFGLLPAWRAGARRDLGETLKEGKGALAAGGWGARRVLVVGETALALMLLAGAGLLLRSFVGLRAVDPGFDAGQLMTFDLSLPAARYDTPEKAGAFVATALEELRRLPGVESAGAVFGLPLSGFRYSISLYELDGRRFESAEDDVSVQVRIVTPGYFEALRLPLQRGRGVDASDRAGSAPVVWVNEAAARLLWPGGEPLGRRLVLSTGFGLERGRAGGEVAGVVRDVRHFGPAAEAAPEVYLAHAQWPVDFVSVALRSAGEPLALLEPARQALRRLDPEVPLARARTMEQLLALSVARPRFYLTLLAAFAVAALVLAAIGVYGVMAFAASRRVREIGIRVALGAQRRDILRLLLAESGRLALAGIALGAAGTLAAARLLAGLLHGVGPRDPATLLAVAALLLGVALTAAWLPARRAARLEPTTALRAE
jgi:predicted permease